MILHRIERAPQTYLRLITLHQRFYSFKQSKITLILYRFSWILIIIKQIVNQVQMRTFLL